MPPLHAPVLERPEPVAVRRHLYELDVVRVLTFACVIFVHTASSIADPSDHVLLGLLALAHMTRFVFFGLSAFVLILRWRERPQKLRRFWPRRFLLVGMPYAAWSAIYLAHTEITATTTPGWMLVAHAYVTDLVTSAASYQLYFLLVTMQVYLLVPVIAWFVRVTARHHALVVALAFVVQIALFASYAYRPSWTAWLSSTSIQGAYSYEFFLIGGAVAAAHVDGVLAFVRRRRGAIAGATLLVAVCTSIAYVVQALHFQNETRAGVPFQPVEVVWGSVVAVAFAALGAWWADNRQSEQLLSRAVSFASDRSFQIFLVHPLLITVVLTAGGSWLQTHLGHGQLTLVTYLLVLCSALLVGEVLRRTPVSLALTGRPSLRSLHRRRVSRA